MLTTMVARAYDMMAQEGGGILRWKGCDDTECDNVGDGLNLDRVLQ